MENMVMLFKPPALVIKRKGDLEQLSKDWEEYINNFKIFLEATMAAGGHNDPEVADTPCTGCIKSKNLLMLVGGGRSQNPVQPCRQSNNNRQLG